MKRYFSRSTQNLSRKTFKYLIEKSKNLVPEKDGLGSLDIQTLSGDLNKDGLNRYELDFVEAAEFTNQLLTNMANDGDKLKG